MRGGAFGGTVVGGDRGVVRRGGVADAPQRVQGGDTADTGVEDTATTTTQLCDAHDCDGPGGCNHHSHHSPGNPSSFKASLEAALASSEMGDAAGTATYLAPSLFNHSCDPNVDVAWDDGDAGMR